MVLEGNQSFSAVQICDHSSIVQQKPATEQDELECRICQEEESDPSQLEIPCACSGSLKYAHRKCIQRWCDEKGNIVCEICQQPYKDGYIIPQCQSETDSISIDLSDDWELPFAHVMRLHGAPFFEPEFDEVAVFNSKAASFCRTVALVLLVLLLLHHGILIAASSTDHNALMFLTVRALYGSGRKHSSGYFSEEEMLIMWQIFLLRIVGFFLPCYIMIRSMDALQAQQHVRSSSELRFLLQSGNVWGFEVALTPSTQS